MRINARLDQDRTRKVEALRQITQMTVSEIVKRAIDVYYREVRQDRPNPAEILAASGFIGAARAGRDLSEGYKSHLAESLNSKHDHR